jgi:antitoxin (DNA-binding transcriptional repressor) of toxin-antitoxin stability system
MSQVAIEVAAGRLAELVRETSDGEEIILLEDDVPVAKLVPLLTPDRPVVKRGYAKGRVLYMAPDFDDTPEGFEEYTS